MEWAKSMVPHACFFIDSPLKATLEGLELLAYSSECPAERLIAEEDLERLWKKEGDDFHILPCLSVRSGLDLYLSVKNYPPGSEIILSAINIPTVIHIIHHHDLKVRSCDINISTMGPSVEHLSKLINERTVAVLMAHVYGKRFDMKPIVQMCQRHSIDVLEDCAEAFNGLNYKGHAESDVVFFSFGVIKIATTFGGAIVKVKTRELYESMRKCHNSYPIQTKCEYARKLAKYSVITTLFNTTWIFRYGISAFRLAGIDHKKVFVPLLRGFPTDLIAGIRRQPSVVLLNNLAFKLTSFSENDLKLIKDKGDYVTERLPHPVTSIGQQALYASYWLFPILVEHPDEVILQLNELGVDATRGSTQLQVVPDDVNATCHESKIDDHLIQAKYLMQQIVYLPVHKLVPYAELDKIIDALNKTMLRLRCNKLVLPASS